MARKPRVHAPGALYHAILRGNAGGDPDQGDAEAGNLLPVAAGAAQFEAAVRPRGTLRPTTDDVCRLVCKEMGLDAAGLSGASRERRQARARHRVAFLTLEKGCGTLSELSRRFGRDPAGLRRGVERVRGRSRQMPNCAGRSSAGPKRFQESNKSYKSSLTPSEERAMGGAKIDQKKVAAAWAARGFGCGLWVDPPGQRWEDFTHDTDEVVMLLEGEMEFEVEGEVHHPRIGEELIIPARALHSARNIGATTARWLYGYKRG